MPTSSRFLAPLLLAAGAYHAALGAFMWIAPGTFYEQVAPYPPRSDHFVGDLATFTIAQGVLLLAAWRLPRWRVPALAFAAFQYALHVFNHVIDVNESDKGTSNLVALAALGLVLGWMLAAAVREERA